jgi:hypothetical protein
MAVTTTFRFDNGDLVPYDLPWGSHETFADILDRQGYRKDVSLALGRPYSGFHVEVHEATDLNASALDFAFIVLVRIGETSHPIFCRELPDLLDCLLKLAPTLELDLKCAEQERLAQSLNKPSER